MPQCQFLFFAVFGFRKVTQEIFSKRDRMKAKVPIFPDTKTESRAEMEKSHEAASPALGASPPLAAPRCGVGPSGAHRPRPSTHILPPSRKPEIPSSYSTKIPAAPPPPKTSFGGQKFLFRHPAGTGIDPRSHRHRLHHLHFDSMMVCE